tara:strand:- start:2151 stop:2630 length:480 start_codon:yes stop_codon:yes gene_type:complete
MKRTRYTAVLSLALMTTVFTLLPQAASADESGQCREEEGNLKHELGEWKEAYELLWPCMKLDSTKGITLYRLGDHVGYGGYGGYKSKRLRRLKQSGLYFLSALKGYRPGITRLLEALDAKYEYANHSESFEMAKCLRSTLEQPESRRGPLFRVCVKVKD